jgi:hypothetical protein
MTPHTADAPLCQQVIETQHPNRSSLGMWVVSRYDDRWAVMRDPHLGKHHAPRVELRLRAAWRRHPSLTDGEPRC